MNKAERFRRIDELFRAATRLPAEDRATFLDRECDDASIRAEVAQLLSVDKEPTGQLDQPALGQEVRLSRIIPAGVSRPTIPERIGQYRVIGRIGEGGMGVVYEAEQDSPRRTVALKVITAGIASTSVLRRFDQEAQVLGRLQHPGIAQVYEAGTFEGDAGVQPFFAMELIRGQPLTQYATINDLSTHARLELMIKIADAVQHAHQRGVIHRDIKPTNIIVDEAGDPKILDFGVARATDSGIHTTTLQTDVGQLVGTIPYMSPEQAAGDPAELDTRSDVYALGVVTYELLAGRLPYDVRKKIIHEAVRMIREDTPIALSSINPVLRGDVETIVGKAMEKDKTRRYQSASALSADIRRYLHHEPIAARPPSTWYQLAKFARRNTAVVVGVAAVFVVVLAGAVVSSVFAVGEARARQKMQDALTLAEDRRGEADEAREAAELSRDESDGVVTFLTDMLAAADPAAQGKDVLVRDVIDDAAEKIGDEFSDRPLIEARLRHTMSMTYRTLGEYEKAAREGQRAVEIRAGELGPLHVDTLDARRNLGMVYWRQGREDEAEAIYEEVLAEVRTQHGEDHETVVTTRNLLANVFLERGQWPEAEREFTEIVALSERVLGPENRRTLLAQNNLGLVYMRQGRLDESEAAYRKAYEAQRRVLGEEHPDTLISSMNLGSIFVARQEYDRGQAHLTAMLPSLSRVFGAEHPHTLTARQNLGTLLMQQGEYEQAEKDMLELLEIRRRVSGPDHPTTGMQLIVLGYLYERSGQLEKALPLMREMYEFNRRTRGPIHPNTIATLTGLISTHSQMGSVEEGEAIALEAIADLEREFGPQHDSPLRMRNSLATLYRDNERFAAAEEQYGVCAEGWRITHTSDHPEVLNALKNLAFVIKEQGRADDAVAVYREAIERSIAIRGEEDPATLQTMNQLAVLLRNERRFDEAIPLYEQTLSLRRRVLGVDHRDTLTTFSGFARLYSFKEEFDTAESMWLETLEVRERTLGPDHADTRKTLTDLIDVYGRQGRPDKAGPMIDALAEATIDDVGEMNDIAWMLLTCEPAELRRPGRGLELAMECNERSGFTEANYLDTLALALHVNGRHEEAVRYEREAISRLSADDVELRQSMQAALETFEAALEASEGE